MVFYFKFIQSFLRLLAGAYNFLKLLFQFHILTYYSVERDIIKKINKYKNSKILLISGGDSLFNNWDNIKNYEYIALNSYNTFNRLSLKQQAEIQGKIIIYYQAPFHFPIKRSNYDNSVLNVITKVNDDCICIFDSDLNKFKEINFINKNYYDFKIHFGLNNFGGSFINTSGAITLLDILIKSGFQNIDLLGVDLDFYRTDKFNSINEIAIGSFMNSLFYYELNKCKTKYAKNKLLKINNLSFDSVFNLN